MAGLAQLHVFSHTLNMEMEVWAVLPELPAFDAPGKKFKVLWEMPSGSCNYSDWIRHSDLENMAAERDLVVFMPGLHRSCGTNMFMGGKYGEWVAKELPQTMRNMFTFLSDKREDNFISGFSNGGYACMYLAFHYPEVYGAVAGLAAGDKADANWEGRPWTLRVPVYGDGDFHNTPYSYKYVAAQLIENNSPYVPRVFHAYGLDEEWVYMNEYVRDFFNSYKDKGDPFDYCCYPIKGIAHNFRMCEMGLAAFFDYLKLPVINPESRKILRQP